MQKAGIVGMCPIEFTFYQVRQMHTLGKIWLPENNLEIPQVTIDQNLFQAASAFMLL